MTEEKKDALTRRDVGELAKDIETAEGGYALRTVKDAMDFADWTFQSGMLPDQIRNAKQAFAIMARGAEMGLKPHASWRWIYMTKGGKLSMETKGMLAVCQSSPHFAGYKEWIENEEGPEETWKAVAVAQRKGREDQIKTFSFKDAEKAKLTGPKKKRDGGTYDSTYVSYLKDMLLARARGRALEMQFSDVLGGIAAREIVEEIEEREAQEGKLKPAPGTVTVSDPLLDEVSQPQKEPEVQGVIDAQVEEIFDAEELGAVVTEPGEMLEEPPEPEGSKVMIQTCQGCGVIYHIDREACPECGVKSGEDPGPPSVEEDKNRPKKKRKAKKGQGTLLE